MTKNLVIYHFPCNDGVGAAAICNMALPPEETEYLKWNYNKGLPNYAWHSDLTVYVVDFSFLADDTLRLCSQVKRVIVLDHHDSAIKRLIDELPVSCPDNLELILDKNFSGTGLTWNYFFPTHEMPMIFQHIQDRDTWVKKLPNTDIIHEALMSEQPDYIEMEQYTDANALALLVEKGNTLLKYKDALYAEMLSTATVLTTDWGQVVFSFCQHSLASNFLEYAQTRLPDVAFGAAVVIKADTNTVKFSFRCLRKTVCVSELAEMFEGGGHAFASGCSVDLHSFFMEFNKATMGNTFNFSGLTRCSPKETK